MASDNTVKGGKKAVAQAEPGPVEVDRFGNEVVRVRIASSRHEITIARTAYEAAEPGAYDLLNKPALAPNGNLAPVKHYKDLGTLSGPDAREAVREQEGDK